MGRRVGHLSPLPSLGPPDGSGNGFVEQPVMASACVVGIDFGTDSVRAVVVEATTGQVLGTSVKHYPRWAAGLYCDPPENTFRQHPLDYLESMEGCLVEALVQAGATVAGRVRGIAVDTTGSTPALADQSGMPLAMGTRFTENPNAIRRSDIRL